MLANELARHRDSADAILANSTTKLFRGPVGGEATLSYLARLLGDEQVQLRSKAVLNGRSRMTATPSFRPMAPAHSLLQLDVDRALLIEGRLPPAVVRVIPWWEDRQLRRRAG